MIKNNKEISSHPTSRLERPFEFNSSSANQLVFGKFALAVLWSRLLVHHI